MVDKFANFGSDLESPGAHHFPIVPSDTIDLAVSFRAIYVGGTGNISIVDVTGVAVTYVGVPTGSIIPMRGKRINVTSTTATNLVGIY